jgi:hypothetical protein
MSAYGLRDLQVEPKAEPRLRAAAAWPCRLASSLALVARLRRDARGRAKFPLLNT